MKNIECCKCGKGLLTKVYKANRGIEYVCNSCEAVVISGAECVKCNGAGKILNVSAAQLYFDAVRSPISSRDCDECDALGVICNE